MEQKQASRNLTPLHP
jgi:hypothetical protein